eukprot:TRINITY_DN58327_c0_g1_i1.p2 TRINITY_DN58327_c0_g1~~TRINITY_DN58327_c0_g1_i1.p2  ORF type:complete len:142 (+),score=9.15 TRINITY_DN58327_c0_g1_i1:53-478(+)
MLSAISYFLSYVYYYYWYDEAKESLDPVLVKFISLFVMLPKSQSDLKSAFNFSVATFLSFVNGSYSAIMKDCFASFLCDEIGGERVIKNNYEVGCNEPSAKLLRGFGTVQQRCLFTLFLTCCTSLQLQFIQNVVRLSLKLC